VAPEQRDWVAWHTPYDEPGSNLERRLRWVQRRIRQVLDEAKIGPIRVLSLCAGQGRDLLEVLADHPRRHDVTGLLVELDERNVAEARAHAEAAGLAGIDVVQADASSTSAFAEAVPADLLLVCGVYGNISDADIAKTVRHLPELCAPGALTIWTRHRGDPDLTPAIRQWYVDAGFEELTFDTDEGFLFGVGTFRLTAPPLPYSPGVHLFDFIGH
jgi:SAM-dependent methyltransferase